MYFNYEQLRPSKREVAGQGMQSLGRTFVTMQIWLR